MKTKTKIVKICERNWQKLWKYRKKMLYKSQKCE